MRPPVIQRSGSRAHAGVSWQTSILLALLLAAIAMGLYGRFVGLGTWPLGVDEFYTARSIDNILRTGLPHFSCGGFYTRGLSYQYVVALVRSSGLSAELGGRLVSGFASLLGLPAAYLLGRRLQGRVLGLLLVTVLLVSVWEIEMARFARMYAPFQSIFLWYVVFFLRYTVDRDRGAIVPMVLLSLLGALTWEGGALLGVANLLPPFLQQQRGRLAAHDWRYLTLMLILLATLAASMTDLRGSPPAPLPTTAGAVLSTTAASPGPAMRLGDQFAVRDLLWLLPYLAVLLLAARALPWLWGLRQRWLASAGLCIALLSGLCHQFALSAAILALLWIARIVHPRDLRSEGSRRYVLAWGTSAAYWLAFGVTHRSWQELAGSEPSRAHRLLALLQHLGGTADVIDAILRPWGRTLPWLTLGGLACCGGLLLALGGREDRRTSCVRALLALVATLAVVIGAGLHGRLETRYTFFLYPLVLALSFTALIYLTRSVLHRRRFAPLAAGLMCLLAFAMSGDFQPRHVLRIDSREVNFRLGMSPVLADHYYPRADYRLMGEWLRQHVQPGDFAMIGIPSVAAYYRGSSFFFLQASDPRYEDYACSNGTTERWTNLPLLHGIDALTPLATTGKRIVLLLYPEMASAMIAQAQQRHWQAQLVWNSPDGGASALMLTPRPQ